MNAVGWSRLERRHRGPDADALRVPERQDDDVRREDQHAADEGVPRAGFVEGTFGLECLMDELAAKLGLDPLELRRRNHADPDDDDGRPFS